ncbi:MAG TPA: hypothetical protein VNL70_11640 [Tepidisphaeraceae bacterium]|nr:hypothetical protein [Tepidisphaeraceae bacterium]
MSCPAGLMRSIGFVSAGVLAFEIALMRLLLIASWHHFAFLVISIGMLGFGLSGTVLLVAGKWLAARPHRTMPALVVATALSMPLCVALAQHVPIEARLVPALYWRQIGQWLAYWVILTIPFLLGATTIGLGLLLAQRRIAAAYATNLIGSGAGAALLTAAIAVVEPAWLPVLAGLVTLAGFAWSGTSPSGHAPGSWVCVAVAALPTLAVAFWLAVNPPSLQPDPFKFSSHLARLQEQGDVRRIARRLSPRGVVEVFSGKVFHELPFLSLDTPGDSTAATLPPMHALVIDGHWSGSILQVDSLDDAAVVDRTLMAVCYDLLQTRQPQVLLLGERGGANVWLAARRGASRVVAVQPEPQIPRLLQQLTPALTNLPAASFVVADPRHFLDRPGDGFDLIQLVALEGSAAGSGGMAGLGQDYLITVEGLHRCLRRLKPGGIVSVCRGIQLPPRDNLKLFAAIAEALRRDGIDNPLRHVVIVRDYLAVCTMVRGEPWSDSAIQRVRQVCRSRQLTPVWFEGIGPDELNRPDAMPGPPGSNADWYHHAAVQLLGPSRAEARRFIDQWQFDIRPPTDDRPFFLDFCRVRAIGAMREAFADLWLTRAELAFLFVLAAIGVVTLVAALTLLLPPLLLPGVRRARGKAVAAAYFASIGLAYLMLEITLLSRLIQLIGDPVLAASVTITTFLIGSGIGSLIVHSKMSSSVIDEEQPSLQRDARMLPVAVAGIVLFSTALLICLGALSARLAAVADIGRIALAVLLMLPAAVLMGMPMPTALKRLERDRPQLIPWAWGVNGFASVLASPLATAMGMTWGFSSAAATAVLLYLLAAAVFALFPRSSASATHASCSQQQHQCD